MPSLDASAIAAIVQHMNDDHADAIVAYARHFGGMPDADTATLVNLDADGMRIVAFAGTQKSALVVDFDHALRDAEDARDTLIAMAREAAR